MLAVAYQPQVMPTLIRVEPDPVDVVDFLYLAEVVTRKFYRGKEKIRDTELFSVACQELVKAGQRHNSEIGPFDRFAMRAIRNGIVDHLRLQQSKKRAATFDVLSEREWQEMPWDSEAIDFDFDLLTKSLESLPADDRRLIEEIYLENKTVAQVAEIYSVSRVTIYNRTQKILLTLREKLTA